MELNFDIIWLEFCFCVCFFSLFFLLSVSKNWKIQTLKRIFFTHVCSTLFIIIYFGLFTVAPDVPPMPYLVPTADIHRDIGESFTVSCYVKVMTGVRPFMTWSYSTSAKQVWRLPISYIFHISTWSTCMLTFQSATNCAVQDQQLWLSQSACNQTYPCRHLTWFLRVYQSS